jgi:signal transduction histidine kinase
VIREHSLAKSIKTSLKNAAVIGRMTSNVLDSAAGDERTDEVSIELLLDRAVSLYEDRLGGVVVKRAYGNIERLQASEKKIDLVVRNVVSNAVDAVGGKGEILLATSEDKNFLYFDVSDTGPGLPEESVERVFEPFYTSKGSGEGAGIGLSISKEIVSQYGGSISIINKKGYSTTFHVALPKTPNKTEPGH